MELIREWQPGLVRFKNNIYQIWAAGQSFKLPGDGKKIISADGYGLTCRAITKMEEYAIMATIINISYAYWQWNLSLTKFLAYPS